MKKQTRNTLNILWSSLLMLCLTACTEEVEVEVTVDPLTVRTISPSYEDFTTTGSTIASLEPATRVNVVPTVQGEIQRVFVSLGDYVSVGSTICTIDSEMADTQRENAEDAVLRAQEALQYIEDSLIVNAPISGYIQSIEAKLDHSVSASSQLAYMNNRREMTVKIPFLDSMVDSSWIGETANLTFVDTGEKLTGTVTEISGTPSYLYSNIAVNYVTINVTNPGGIQDGRRVAAEINGITCTADGSFTSEADSPVMSGLNGTVDSIYINVGDYVTAGEPMFRIVSVATDNQILNAQNSINDAQDAVEDAVELLEDYVVTAPISGTITEVYMNALDTANGGSPVVEISTTNDTELTFSVSESVVSYLKVGQTLGVQSHSGEGTGTITNIAKVANSQTGLFTIQGRLVSGSLLSGTSATVSYTDYIESNALVIPFESIQFVGDQCFVFVVEDNTAVKKEVFISRYSGDKVIIKEGLTSDDLIISTWSAQLRNGLEVQEEVPVSDTETEETVEDTQEFTEDLEEKEETNVSD